MYAPQPRLLTRYRKYILVATILFVAGIIIGVAASLYYPTLIKEAITLLEQELARLAKDVFTSSPSRGIMTLFLHNVRAVIMVAALGIILGIYPIFAMLLNGLIIGVVGIFSAPYTGLIGFLAGIVPHGIFEIPALLIGAGLGLRLGLAPLFNRRTSPFASPRPNAWQGYGNELGGASKILLYCIGLLLIAAVIEVTVTPRVMQLFGLGI